MVQGLEKFRDWFSGYNNRYVLIGGSACNLIYARYGAPERATRDIDIVIVAEAFDNEFYKRFIEFVKAGGYYNKDKSGKYELYRFSNPADSSFPAQIELLSRKPEILKNIDTVLGRFKTTEKMYSLSAIMLDDDYYELLKVGIEQIDGLPVLSLNYLPVFKIHAWKNLTEMKANGQYVPSEEIGKHRRDVLRLCALFPPDRKVSVKDSIKTEIEQFVNKQPWDDNMLRNLKLQINSAQMAEVIRSVYDI